MIPMIEDLRADISEALYRASINFEITEENGCLMIQTDSGHAALVRSSQKATVLNLGLLVRNLKEGLTDEQLDNLPLWLIVESVEEAIRYLKGEDFQYRQRR